MGDFRDFESGRSDRSGGSRGGRGFGGGRSFGGSRGGFGGRGGFGRGRDRRDMAPCDAVCAKCGKDCQVPFKPTGDKPVYCSACFSAQRDSAPRSSERPSFAGSSTPSVSPEQFQQLNEKLDKILAILESLEIIDEEDVESANEAEPAPESVESDPEEN